MKKEYIKPAMLIERAQTPCQMLATSQPDDVPWWDGECDVNEFRGILDGNGSSDDQGHDSFLGEDW